MEDSISITRKTWKFMPERKKRQWLKIRGFSTSWAKTKNIEELVSHGGGMVAKDLHYVVKRWKAKNPQIKRILWKKI